MDGLGGSPVLRLQDGHRRGEPAAHGRVAHLKFNHKRAIYVRWVLCCRRQKRTIVYARVYTYRSRLIHKNHGCQTHRLHRPVRLDLEEARPRGVHTAQYKGRRGAAPLSCGWIDSGAPPRYTSVGLVDRVSSKKTHARPLLRLAYLSPPPPRKRSRPSADAAATTVSK